jgi:hypothetical protein
VHCAGTCRSNFNANFNILLSKIYSASFGENKDFDNIKIKGTTTGEERKKKERKKKPKENIL